MGIKLCSSEKCDHQLYSEAFPPMKVFTHNGKEYCAECILNFPFDLR